MAIKITHAVHGMQVSSADKKLLSILLTQLVQDIEKVRAAQYAMAQKLDTSGAAGTGYASSNGAPPGSLNVTAS